MKSRWTWGYVVGRDRLIGNSVCNTYFDQVKENGKVDKTLTYEEAKLLKEQLGFPYYIKRIKVTKSRLGENSYEF